MIKPDECGDFVKANELLKKQIEKQYDGKNLHKNFLDCFVTPTVFIAPEKTRIPYSSPLISPANILI